MTLNGVMAVYLRYLAKLGSFQGLLYVNVLEDRRIYSASVM